VFAVDPADIDETAGEDEQPFPLARRLAREKALAVSRRHPDALVIGSDQAGVTDDGTPLSKCWEAEDAVTQLMTMSGGAHTFLSAAAIVLDGDLMAEVEEQATVTFRAFDEDEARAYVALGEWQGSAGSYHLEGRGVRLVRRVSGPDNAVYGLPLLPLLQTLRALS
jgi:septum formation protein